MWFRLPGEMREVLGVDQAKLGNHLDILPKSEIHPCALRSISGISQDKRNSTSAQI